MAYIRKEALVEAPLNLVWAALRDIGALHTRLVPGFVVDTRLEQDARIVTFFNGQTVREIIVDVSETDHRVAWAIADPPFRHYNSSAQVIADSPERCRFVWITDLLPNELREPIAQMMDRGIQTIQATLAQRP